MPVEPLGNMAATQIMNVLQVGCLLSFESPLLFTNLLVHLQTYVPGSLKDLALRDEVKEMLKKGAIEVVTGQSPSFYSRIFLVEKASGGWRPIVDLSPLK